MKRLIPIVLLAASLTGCAGVTPLQRVVLARQAYTTTLEALTKLSVSGVIADRETKDAIYALRLEVHDALDAAEQSAIAGNPIGFQLVMQRVNSGLDRLLIFLAQHRKQIKEVVWIRLPSRPLSSLCSTAQPDWARFFRSSTPAPS